jgi:predicted aspartyl protease
MPHFTLSFTQGTPMIDVVITASAPRLQALTTAGQPLPSPISIRALLDTGASHTCVDPSVLNTLGLQATGSVPMLTPSTGATPMNADTYDVAIVIPNGAQQGLMLANMQVSASELLKAQGFHALIGRDILSKCILVYNGAIESVSISY